MTDAPHRAARPVRSRAESALVAVLTTVWASAPEWTATPARRRAVRGGCLAAAGVVGLLEVRRDRDEPTEPDPGPSGRTGLALGALVVVAVLASIGAHRGVDRLNDAGVAALRRRGVRRPATVVGVAWGVLSLALDEVERRAPA